MIAAPKVPQKTYDKAMNLCMDKATQAYRKEAGSDAVIRADMIEEMQGTCDDEIKQAATKADQHIEKLEKEDPETALTMLKSAFANISLRSQALPRTPHCANFTKSWLEPQMLEIAKRYDFIKERQKTGLPYPPNYLLNSNRLLRKFWQDTDALSVQVRCPGWLETKK